MATRRSLLLASLAAALPARAAAPDKGDLLKPGPLPDLWLGPDGAKVAIVEYASLTCGHCARFHRDTWPALKTRWVDPGHVRYTLRPFPLDPLSTVAFMLVRSEPERYYERIDLLFASQHDWTIAEKPLDALRQTLLTTGFAQESVERVLRDQALLDAVNGVRDRGEKAFGVEATPTFFIDGQKRQGAISIDDIEAIIRPILGL